MNDELDHAAYSARAACVGIGGAVAKICPLIETALTSAAACAITAVPAAARVKLQRLTLALDGPLDKIGGGPISARPRPIADAMAAELDFAVHGTSSLAVAVELRDHSGAVIGTATVGCVLHGGP